jgi:uridylate kinase
MKKNKKELIVLSLGGSIIAPDKINVDFLKKLKKLLVKKISEDKRFIIVTGGGRIAREYQQSAGKVTKLTNDDLDWLGIHATRLNAHLVRTIFRDYAHPVINKNPTETFGFKEPMLIASGWKPGFSTDFDAVKLAEAYGATKVINMTNIDYVYDIDPRKSNQAKPLEKINWQDYRKLVGDRWNPGSNAPFDPIASKMAEKLKIQVVVLNGNDLKNFNKCLEQKKFKGTVIDN